MTIHIIRTIADLEALDPDTCILDSRGEPWLVREAKDADGSWITMYTADLPAVVVTTVEQIRAARAVLEGYAYE